MCGSKLRVSFVQGDPRRVGIQAARKLRVRCSAPCGDPAYGVSRKRRCDMNLTYGVPRKRRFDINLTYSPVKDAGF